MNISNLNIGIIHSLIGKNDGVSIVIDQTVNAMVSDMGVGLGNIFFLAAHSSPRFNAETNDIFWHKNEINKTIIRTFSTQPPENFDKLIHDKALEAKEIIANWVKNHSIDLIIAHNTSHPYNFITAVGLGYFIEELRDKGIVWPKVLAWWHDSYFERDQFKNPNAVIKQYLKYLPGTETDGIVFINKAQIEIARKLFQSLHYAKVDKFFDTRAIIIPNTSSINWSWHDKEWNGKSRVAPDQDNYNSAFLHDIGLLEEIEKYGCTLENTIVLLQHTRIVPRKRIDIAIDFAFALEKKFASKGIDKCLAVLISGHSGDEQTDYKNYLKQHFETMRLVNPDARVVLLFGEDRILSHRDIIVDKKYYSFSEIPSIVASLGGIGTYFSEIEGFGNNLLEMVSLGLPVVINKYETYKSDIEQYGFTFPSIDNCKLTEVVIDETYQIIADYKLRNKLVKHNLETLEKNLSHQIISEKLKPLILDMFTRILNLESKGNK